MQASSLIFFGLLAIPLIAFLFWIIKKDKKKNFFGLALLLVGAIIAAYTIVRLDSSFVKEKIPAAPKASSFR
jgi:FtsH-binding integral membrane protein